MAGNNYDVAIATILTTVDADLAEIAGRAGAVEPRRLSIVVESNDERDPSLHQAIMKAVRSAAGCHNEFLIQPLAERSIRLQIGTRPAPQNPFKDDTPQVPGLWYELIAQDDNVLTAGFVYL